MAISGKDALINGVCNHGTKWTVEIDQDLLDATTFCSNGFREYVKGLIGATYTIEALEPIDGAADIDGEEIVFKNNSITITGTTLHSKITYDTTVDGLCTFTYTGNFTGEFETGVPVA